MTLFNLIQVGLLKMEVYLDNFIIWTQSLFAVIRDYILVFSVTYQKKASGILALTSFYHL